jgi:hypothetical protein
MRKESRADKPGLSDRYFGKFRSRTSLITYPDFPNSKR